MRIIILLASISILSGCAHLKEWFGQDPFDQQQASCPVLPYYEVPKLTNVNGVPAISEDSDNLIGLTQTQMGAIGTNFGKLISTIKQYQSAVSTYNAAYTEPTE